MDMNCIISFSPTSLPITPSLLHSRLKTDSFYKSIGLSLFFVHIGPTSRTLDFVFLYVFIGFMLLRAYSINIILSRTNFTNL